MSWEKVRLGEYVSLVGGGTPSKDNELYWGGDIPWVTVKDFKRDIISKTDDCITLDGLNNCAAKLVPAGTLLFATRMAIGKVAITCEEVAFNQDVKAIFCKSGILKKYLFYLVKFYEVYFQSVASGATVKGIKINHILDLEIPLPPLPIQEKIANILATADLLRRKDQELQAKYDELARAIFIDMFGDPIRNEKEWGKSILRNCYGKGVKCGPFGSALKKEEFVDVGVPVWNMDNIVNYEFIDVPYLYVSASKFQQLKQYELNKGDIIISRAGTVGKMCVVTTQFKNSLLSTNLIRLSLLESKVKPIFFVYLMKYFSKRIGRLKTGSEDGFTHMNTGVLDNIEIYVPPKEIQDVFAKKIEIINALKAKAKANAEKSEELFQSLLQRAFKGELVN